VAQPQDVTALVTTVLDAAASDGHCVLPHDVVISLLIGRGLTPEAADAAVADALDAGTVVRPTPHLLARADLAEAETWLADRLGRLALDGGLLLVDSPAGAASEELAAELVDVHPITDADALDVPALAAALRPVPDDTAIALVGDAGMPPPAGPGRPFAELVACADSLDIPVERQEAPAGPIGALCAAVRAGTLPAAPQDPQRRLVIVHAPDSLAARHRAQQLVTDSIPRVFGLGLDDIAVVTPMSRGPAGAAALREAGLPAYTLAQARRRRWPAVVAMLPAEACGLLTREVVYGLFSRAEQHLSIVHAASAALAHAVRHVPSRPRRTRLTSLIGGVVLNGSPEGVVFATSR